MNKVNIYGRKSAYGQHHLVMNFGRDDEIDGTDPIKFLLTLGKVLEGAFDDDGWEVDNEGWVTR